MELDAVLEKVRKNVKESPIVYQSPFLIFLSGFPGSGKSVLSKILSKELGLYIISGDHIRKVLLEENPDLNLHTPSVRNIINEICLLEMQDQMQKGHSVIIDRNVMNERELSYLKQIFHITIGIQIKTTDAFNIERVKKRMQEQIDQEEALYFGHQDLCSGIVDDVGYWRARDNKVCDLKEEAYQFFIENEGDITSFKKDAFELACKIKKAYPSMLDNFII